MELAVKAVERMSEVCIVVGCGVELYNMKICVLKFMRMINMFSIREARYKRSYNAV